MQLAELRKSVGMSQRELAQATGISYKLVQSYEQGVRDINGARISTLLSLCIVLKCRLEQLITDENIINQIKLYTEGNNNEEVH